MHVRRDRQLPALNARPARSSQEWIERIDRELAEFAAANPGAPVAPFAVNQIVHASNDRLRHDLDACGEAPRPHRDHEPERPDRGGARIHEYGGLVFHDVIG
jgi:nitronate monooxygenase